MVCCVWTIVIEILTLNQMINMMTIAVQILIDEKVSNVVVKLNEDDIYKE